MFDMRERKWVTFITKAQHVLQVGVVLNRVDFTLKHQRICLSNSSRCSNYNNTTTTQHHHQQQQLQQVFILQLQASCDDSGWMKKLFLIRGQILQLLFTSQTRMFRSKSFEKYYYLGLCKIVQLDILLMVWIQPNK